MTAIAFDTLKFAKRLKDAGILPTHAEAEAEALAEVLGVNLKELATKDDLARMEERLTERFDARLAQLDARLVQLEQRTDARLVQLEQRTDARLVQLEQRMVIKLGGLMVVAVGAVATLVKLL